MITFLGYRHCFVRIRANATRLGGHGICWRVKSSRVNPANKLGQVARPEYDKLREALDD